MVPQDVFKVRNGTYQIAHDNLAVSAGSLSLSRSRFGGSTASTSLGVLLDATDRGCWRGTAVDTSRRLLATATAATLGGGDLLKGLVKLARHDEVGLWRVL